VDGDGWSRCLAVAGRAARRGGYGIGLGAGGTAGGAASAMRMAPAGQAVAQTPQP
jgi:hypothetical protein